MSIWNKVGTLFRATAREPAESLVRANDIRIFEQEIYEAEQHLQTAKVQLAHLVMERRQLEKHNNTLIAHLADREQQAIAALNKEAPQLAEELAGLIASDEVTLTEQRAQITRLLQKEQTLKCQMQQAAQKLGAYRRELNLAKVNRATSQSLRQLQGASGGLSGSLSAMESSLVAIQSRHSRAQDFDEAMQEIQAELNGETLEKKLDEAGIETRSESSRKRAVLERLYQQASPHPKAS